MIKKRSLDIFQSTKHLRAICVTNCFFGSKKIVEKISNPQSGIREKKRRHCMENCILYMEEWLYESVFLF